MTLSNKIDFAVIFSVKNANPNGDPLDGNRPRIGYDGIGEVPHAFRLARRMMAAIRFNLSFSMLLNFTAIILAALGLLNPVTGALVHNAGSVAVILHSALLLKWEGKAARKRR